MRDETCPLPDVDPRVRAYMEPSAAVTHAAAASLKAFAAAFKFAPVQVRIRLLYFFVFSERAVVPLSLASIVLGTYRDSKTALQGTQKKRLFWSDIAGGDGDDDSSTAGAGGDAGAGAGGDAKRAKGGAVPAADLSALKVGSVSPVADFEAMCAHPALVPAALAQLEAQVRDLVTVGGTGAYYKKAAACVAALRAACLMHGESARFNGFLAGGLKPSFCAGRHAGFWDCLVAGGLATHGLITVEEDSAAEATAAEAAALFASPAALAPVLEPAPVPSASKCVPKCRERERGKGGGRCRE